MDLLKTSPENELGPASIAALSWRAIFVACCALALRCWFIHGGVVDNPMVGDAVQYCDYAWNLAYYHTFSMAPPGSDVVAPDSFRDPGYPLLLAILLRLFGSGNAWYHAVLLAQAILGALSSGLAVLISGRWLKANAALAVGLMVAAWPHNVAISGYLLSETLFGFVLLIALLVLGWAGRSQRRTRWAAAGMAFGAASMINATAVPFVPLLALVLWKRREVRTPLLASLLIGSAILPGAWAARGLTLPGGNSAGSRAVTNLVQGSWAEYHSAYVREFQGDSEARRLISAINDETALASRSLPQWLGVAAARFGRDPLHYLAWYAWKPELLWAWDIRMGSMGDVYPYKTLHPIYSTEPAMRASEFLCIVANPLLFALMVASLVCVLAMPVRAEAPLVLYTVALFTIYETLIYTVLQSEPRYSIPLRPLQMMLAVTAVMWIWKRQREAAANRAAGTVATR